jgi:hypothetical protein
LVERRVLAVDGYQFPIVRSERCGNHGATGNEALLVGQGNSIASLEPGDRGAQARGTDDPVDNDPARRRGSVENRIRSMFHHLAQRSRHALPLVDRATRYHHLGVWIAMGQSLQGFRWPSRNEGDDRDFEKVGHLEGLSADGTGRPQDDHRAIHNRPKPLKRM